MSGRYFAKKPHEKRSAAKGPVKIGKRGSRNRRCIRDGENDQYEWWLHATKGWRVVATGNHAVTLPAERIAP